MSKLKQGAFVTDLYVENIKAFKGRHHLDLRDLSGRPAPWTLILGENGVGKTTLLQCLAFMAPVFNVRPADTGRDEFIVEPAAAPEVGTTERYARHGNVQVEMRAKFLANAELGRASTPEQLELETWIRFRRENGQTFDFENSETPGPFNDKEEPLILGYGAGRHMVTGNFEADKTPGTIQSLFDGGIELFDVEELLQHLDYAALKSGTKIAARQNRTLLEMIAALLPDIQDAEKIRIYGPALAGAARKSGVRVTTPYGEVPIHDLSFGYQTMAAWLCDIAWRLLLKYPNSSNPLHEPAIVLVDEIDLHLHPIWQRQVRERLLRHFPAVQFIATAHSPLMAQESIDTNLAVLRREADTAQIINDPPVVSTWRLDQVITSELFGLPTQWSPEVEKLFDEQRELVAKPNRTMRDERRLAEIRNRLLELPTEFLPSDDHAMDIIRRAAAKLEALSKTDE